MPNPCIFCYTGAAIKDFLVIVVWAIIAASAAIASEVYLRHVGRWTWWFVVGGLVISFTLAPVIIRAPSLIAGILVYSTATLVLRALASELILHEHIVRGQAAAIGLMALATAVRYIWR